jgi:hypothetical protein
MRIRGRLTKGLLFALAISLIPVTAVSAQKITPGSTCKVLNQKVVYLKKTYTCTKSAKKLTWNKGVAVKKSTPIPTPTPTPTPTPAPTPTNLNVVSDATRYIQSLINATPITNTGNQTKIQMHIESENNGIYPKIAEERLSTALNFYASLGMSLPQQTIHVILGRTQAWMREQANSFAPGCVDEKYRFIGSASLCALPNRSAIYSHLPTAVTMNISAPDDIDLSNLSEVLRYTNQKTLDQYEGMSPHEAHHAWAGGYYAYAGSDAPKWLWEGGASIFGEMVIAKTNSPDQSYLKLEPGVTGSWNKEQCLGPIESMKPVCEYTQGIIVMEYFLFKFGVDAYIRLTTQSKNAMFADNFQKSTNTSLSDFYKEVNGYLIVKGWNK